ncbi:MAG TPA: NADH-quinone oxidoreductase subunit M, partial [Solirubrobacterales bacterium]|nr:NADH-quinone oxidoreductase subunit M [Solirubrobacterales bacterium]
MIQVLLWLPLAAGLLCFVVPRRSVPVIAVLGTLGTLGLAIAVVAGFNSGAIDLQQTVNESWIPDLGVRYELGVDGINLFLIALTALLWAGATTFSVFRMPERR